MLEVQKFITSYPTFQEGTTALTEKFGIKVNDYEHHVILNYNQIESPKSEPIVMECRGLILCKHTCGVASRSFDRFFNYGEMLDFYSDFDISKATVYTKEDGSLINVWFNTYTSQWEISTRSMAFSEGNHKMGGTFRDWVLKAFNTSEEDFQAYFNSLSKTATYIFEYVGPENRIVKKYSSSKMIMLAIREHTGEYWSDKDMRKVVEYLSNYLNVDLVQSHALSSFYDISVAIKELPTLDEGYVCFDITSGKRMKIKNPSYVAVHNMRSNDGLSIKGIYTLIINNDKDEYLEYFPEDSVFFDEPSEKYAKFIDSMLSTWEKFSDIENQKEFALSVKDYEFSGVLFAARKENSSAKEVFSSMPIEKKLKFFV